MSKVEESFDAEMSGYSDVIMDNVLGAPQAPRARAQLLG